MSDNEATINGLLTVDINADEVWRIMGNCVTGSLRNQHNNDFFIRDMYFDKGKPP